MKEISRNGVVLADVYTPAAEFALWSGEAITVWANSNAVHVQLSETQPPQPPLWHDPIYLPVGQWSRATRFGYFRFKNAVPGQVASVHFTARSG